MTPTPLPGPTPTTTPSPEPLEKPAALVGAQRDASPVVAEGRLLFDGEPVTRITPLAPKFWFRNEANEAAENPQVDFADGAFRIRGLPPGRMGMSARINLEPGNPNLYPGDLDAWSTFVVGEGPPVPFDLHLRKVMRLLQPVDNNVVIGGWDVPCGGGSVHPGKIVFAWEPLDPEAKYEVTINRLACGRGYASAGRAFSASTTETWVKAELEPSAEGECYAFRLSARKAGRPIGMFTIHGRGGLGWDYRFTVK